jgi:protein-tyrosine phosphatase
MEFETMEKQEQRHLSWDSGYNIRDMGGFKTNPGGSTRFGAFVRADNVSERLSEKGKDELISYGIKTIIDLRSPYELEIAPPPFTQPGDRTYYPKYFNTPFVNEDDEDGIEKLNNMSSHIEMYYWMLDRFQKNIGAAVKQIANATEEGSVLFYCHQGRDRTGIVAAFILLLAGVDKQVVADDYALSNENIQPTYTKTLYKNPEVMLATIEYLEQKYSGVSSYLLQAGVTHSELQRLVSHLMG